MRTHEVHCSARQLSRVMEEAEQHLELHARWHSPPPPLLQLLRCADKSTRAEHTRSSQIEHAPSILMGADAV